MYNALDFVLAGCFYIAAYGDCGVGVALLAAQRAKITLSG
ncbi:MAG: S-adenosylhomocysteine hydrolase [Paraglaciecola psychrophila]